MKDPFPDNDDAPAQEKVKRPPLYYWAIVSSEMDDLGLTKTEFRIFAHVLRRCMFWDKNAERWEIGVCNSRSKVIGRITRTHPVYVRWVVDHLVARGLLLRDRRPGSTNELRPSPKIPWLHAHPESKTKIVPPAEEDAHDVHERILWHRIWEIMPDAPRAPFRAKMLTHRKELEDVLDQLESRVRRGQGERAEPGTEPVANVRGLFEKMWAERMAK